jgi:hypothetical protein
MTGETKFDLPYLEHLISAEVEESTHLEYKGADALVKSDTREISKDVSGLANADGGVIVYGIKESRDRKHKPAAINPITDTTITKEWLEHIIGQIAPRIDYTIHSIPVENGLCFVVEVERGTTVHQAADGRYYRRRNFEVVFMEDYEIRDAMFRDRQPRLTVQIIIVHTNHPLLLQDPPEGYLSVIVKNVGSIMARFYRVDLKIPVSCVGKAKDIVLLPTGDALWEASVGYGVDHPLFPGDSRSFKIELSPEACGVFCGTPTYVQLHFGVEIFADNAPKVAIKVPAGYFFDLEEPEESPGLPQSHN